MISCSADNTRNLLGKGRNRAKGNLLFACSTLLEGASCVMTVIEQMCDRNTVCYFNEELLFVCGTEKFKSSRKQSEVTYWLVSCSCF